MRDKLFKLIKYEPHPGQKLLHEAVDNHRFVIAVCGRRFGKTTAAVMETVYQVLHKGDEFGPPLVYLVSDTYDHSRKMFGQAASILTRLMPEKNGKKRIEVQKRAGYIEVLDTGAKIFVKSADNPSSLAGDGVSFAVIEESSFVSDYAMEVLFPSFLERKGKMLAIGTPDRSDTWFKRAFDLGFTGEEDDYYSIQLPSSTNPLIDPEELERIKKKTSTDNFRKYYLAEFVDVDDNPLAGLVANAVVNKEELPPLNGHKYVAGVDLADRNDYTAVVIVDVTEKPYKVVKVERWKGIGYEATGKRIASLLKKYNHARGWVDRTGVGDAALPHITKHYGNIVPVVFTQKEKMNMFDSLAAHLDRQELELLDGHLVDELRNLRAIQTTKGISYAAPNGAKDDVAMAMFLAGKGFVTSYYVPSSLAISGFRVSL